MNALIKKLNINEKYNKKPKIIFDTVRDNTLPVGGFNYMSDLLFLPTTKVGYKYLLTMTDLWSNKCDFEPIKNKNPTTVLTAMKAIFKRGILKKPKASIRVDSGTEFQGVFHKYLYDNNILERVAEPARHQQMGCV